MAKAELSPEQIYSKQALRLLRIGELFLRLDPAAEYTGRTSRIFHLWIPEDAELSERKTPDPEFGEVDRHNKAYNEKARAMPTSISSESDYYVARGERPGEVRIIVERRRVDPGYKTPRIEFPDLGDPEENINQAAEYLTEHFKAIMDRSEEEKAFEKGREILRSTLLAHEQREIILDSQLIAQNQLYILQRDLMIGLQNQVKVDFSNTSTVSQDVQDFLFSTEFNFLSEMRQRSLRNDISAQHKAEMEAILDDFLGR